MSDARARTSGKRLAGLGLATAAVLALAVFSHVRPSRPDGALASPPPDLLGLWTTDDPRYAGRAIEIIDSAIVLHTGEAEPGVHPIREVRVSAVGNRRKVVFTYDGPDSDDELAFTLGEGPPPVLRIVNNAGVAWTRKGRR